MTAAYMTEYRARKAATAEREALPTVAWHASPDAFGGPLVVRHVDLACPMAQAIGRADNPDPALDVFGCPVCVRGERFDARDLDVDMDRTWAEEANSDAYNRSTGGARGPAKSDAQRLTETAEWLSTLGRKVELVDVTHGLRRAAQVWLKRYDGDFGFLVDLKAKGGVRSNGQAKGVLNCWRADLMRGARPAGARPAAAQPAPPAPRPAVADPMAESVLGQLGL